MFFIRFAPLVCSIVLLVIVTPSAIAAASEDSRARVAVADVQAPVAAVPAWDTASPQRLVRVNDALYQEDAGFYYRVVEDVITVRLSEGLGSWEELVLQAEPQDRSALEALTPVRTNRLGIVDLELPDSDPTFWAELVFNTGLARYAEVATYGEFVAQSTDPLYDTQWALNNTGQTGGSAGADIKAEAAWDITTGNPSVVVGILDSGTEINHVDLSANLWFNEDEIIGNEVDDDNNGYVDDYYGWDFGNGNEFVGSPNYHGTHVAGIIIAPGDNGVGVAGLAGGLGTPGVRGMTVQVGDWGPVNGILDDSILYAADNGARIITLSLTVGETSAINDALDYALNEKDVFIDCAAGNNGSSVGYPARRPEVMAVASTDHNDHRSSFSNPGPELEVAAPGTDIRSTQLGSSFGLSSGTSFAAPYVAALAALIRGLAPSLTAAEVRQLIIDTVDDVESPGFDNLTGHGRINAFRALSNIGSRDGTVELDSEAYACSGSFQVTVEDIDLAGDGTLLLSAESDSETVAETVQLTEGDPGIYTGGLTLGVGAAAPDGVVQVSHGDTLTIIYVDFSDGNGGLLVNKYGTAMIDCAGPTITGVNVVDIDDTAARVIWTTSEPANSIVHYGTESPPGDQSSSLESTLTHSVQLSDLEPCTSYRLLVESVDQLGNAAAHDNNGLLYSFQTLGIYPEHGLADCELGQPRLASNVYGCDETVQISVTDLNLDTNPNVAETVTVLMTSTTETDGEWVALTEDGSSSTLFEGSIDLDAASLSGDGRLGASAGDLITVTYFDEDDGNGTASVASFVALTDCKPPAIDNLRVTAISATRAEIEWTSDEPSTSRVEFGPTATLGTVVEDLALTTSHRISVSPFNECEEVYFTVSSTDAYGATRQTGQGGQPIRFNLNRIGGLVFHDNFETDTGWSLEGEWERGIPQQLGSSSKDPAKAFSGAQILGTDLSGSGEFPGDYEPSVNEMVTSPPFDPGDVQSLELVLRRKLGVNATDTASIQMQIFFSQVIWTSDTNIDDQGWVEDRHYLGNPGSASSIRLSFGIESIFPSHAYGWNIDEIIVKDASEPDYLACADCSGSPAFGGVSSVLDPDPCAASGLEIRWEPAPAWGTGEDGTYEIHRGTSAGFVPDETNLIVSGLTETSWIDLTAPVDTPVWYVVRARNDEDCAEGVGLSDSNLIRGSATETIFQSDPASVGQSVTVMAVGQTHVRLSWDPVPGATNYIVRNSLFPNFDSPTEIGSTGETFFEHINAAADNNFYAYRVFALNACGEEGP